jgi:NAD(P)H-nitrite reductase large subunit
MFERREDLLRYRIGGGRPRRLDVPGGRVRGVFILRHGADLAAILDGAKDRANAVVSAPSSSGWRPPVH